MKLLILGGYGVFGGRLVRLLADVADLEIIVSGRSEERARRFCDGWTGAARVRPLALDRSAVAIALRIDRPDLVVDASGPFQDYGHDPYRVVEACIEAGIGYCDFADAADFVFGMSRYDQAAKAAGVFILSGVSSFPVLTAAVLREMARTTEIISVEGGIAPSPYAGIGLNLMRAVVGYAGTPVKLWRDGKPGVGIGLAESRRFTIAVPRRIPLRNIRFSLVDVPDLQVIPPVHPAMTDIWMGAGPVPESLHRVLNLLAKARARLRLPSFASLSPLFYAVLNRMWFGEHRGGMFVRVAGVAEGRPVQRSWHLIAEGDDGPLIPSMAIEGIVRKLIMGVRPHLGARSGVGALDLADYDALFRGRAIATGFRDFDPAAPLYRRVLGSALDNLPRSLRALHDTTEGRRWSGHADVRRGRRLLARLIAAIVGFPEAGSEVPVSVTLAPTSDGGELWTRDFGGRRFSSSQSAGKGTNGGLVVERFGIAAFALALCVEDGRLFLVSRRWFLFGVPMPRFLLPTGSSFESEQDGRFHFSVEIRAPIAGLIVAYEGELELEGT